MFRSEFVRATQAMNPQLQHGAEWVYVGGRIAPSQARKNLSPLQTAIISLSCLTEGETISFLREPNKMSMSSSTTQVFDIPSRETVVFCPPTGIPSCSCCQGPCCADCWIVHFEHGIRLGTQETPGDEHEILAALSRRNAEGRKNQGRILATDRYAYLALPNPAKKHQCCRCSSRIDSQSHMRVVKCIRYRTSSRVTRSSFHVDCWEKEMKSVALERNFPVFASKSHVPLSLTDDGSGSPSAPAATSSPVVSPRSGMSTLIPKIGPPPAEGVDDKAQKSKLKVDNAARREEDDEDTELRLAPSSKRRQTDAVGDPVALFLSPPQSWSMHPSLRQFQKKLLCLSWLTDSQLPSRFGLIKHDPIILHGLRMQ